MRNHHITHKPSLFFKSIHSISAPLPKEESNKKKSSQRSHSRRLTFHLFQKAISRQRAKARSRRCFIQIKLIHKWIFPVLAEINSRKISLIFYWPITSRAEPNERWFNQLSLIFMKKMFFSLFLSISLMMTHQRLMKDLLSFKVPFHAAICTSLWLNWLLNYDPPDSLEIFFFCNYES